MAQNIDEMCRYIIESKDVRTAKLLSMLDDLEAELDEYYIELPKDADGVPIRVGDTLTDDAEFKSEGKVKGLMLDAQEWLVTFGSGWAEVSVHEWHHYHKPTVKDVLTEFAEKITDSQIPGTHPTYAEAIAEYATKFRLAEDE